MKGMKTGIWIVIVLVVLVAGFYIAKPREAIGYISGEAGQCKVKMDISPYSLDAYFKTFTCADSGGTKDCYYLVYDGDTCITSYHYHIVD